MERLHDYLADLYDVQIETFMSGDDELNWSLVFINNTSDLIIQKRKKVGSLFYLP